MSSRNKLTAHLNQIEQDLKSLEVAYEQYFMGIEKREPYQLRQNLTRQLRKLVNLYVPQVDLRFRLQSLSSRFNSYSGHWDRTLRLIDEGRYERHTAKIKRSEHTVQPRRKETPNNPIDSLYSKLEKAHRDCGLRVPPKEQVKKFIERQHDLIQEKFGQRAVDFLVVIEQGKPKIKVRAKQQGASTP